MPELCTMWYTLVGEAVTRVCALGAKSQLKFDIRVPTGLCQFTLTIGTCLVWSGRESCTLTPVSP